MKNLLGVNALLSLRAEQLAGSAFHKVLENPQYGQDFNVTKQDGFKFDFTCLENTPDDTPHKLSVAHSF